MTTQSSDSFQVLKTPGCFAYDINMTNNSGQADQLLSQEIDLSNIDWNKNFH